MKVKNVLRMLSQCDNIGTYSHSVYVCVMSVMKYKVCLAWWKNVIHTFI